MHLLEGGKGVVVGLEENTGVDFGRLVGAELTMSVLSLIRFKIE